MAEILENLASLNQLKDCHKKSIVLAKASLEMNRGLYSGDHHSIASSLNTLATAYQLQEQYEEAESALPA